MSTNSIVQQLKQNDEDYEFYPTKESTIKLIIDSYIKEEGNTYNKKVLSNFSLLDIGAGNGNVFNLIEKYLPEPLDKYTQKVNVEKYAIEKSEILTNSMDKDIMVIGTDFNQQTLIDKKVDIIFCNPPYSEFKEWTLKILNEANCNYIYLVIPERWKNDKMILSALNKRLFKKDLSIDDENYINKLYPNIEIIGSDSFIDSEYRKARANVDIIKIKIKLSHNSYYNQNPFDIWFNNTFKIQADKSNDNIDDNVNETFEQKHSRINELVKGRNLIEVLEELYNKDFEELLRIYKLLETIPYELFKEMNVDLHNIKTNLKNKIKNLKVFYWKELFDNLDKITNKLTSSSRKKLLSKLTAHTNIDFTSGNAYSLIIWVLKNANMYIDEQLKDMYYNMASKDNIKNYKSNKRFLDDTFRYCYRNGNIKRDEYTHFQLDYRLIFSKYDCFNTSSFQYDSTNNLRNNIHEFLNDICTIGHNLGFNVITSSYSLDWEPGKENTFYYKTSEGKEIEFMKIRIYKNGNVHCKPNQEFIKSLNIEMARLNKWVKDETELADELDISLDEVQKYWKSNKKFIVNSNLKLLEG